MQTHISYKNMGSAEKKFDLQEHRSPDNSQAPLIPSICSKELLTSPVHERAQVASHYIYVLYVA